MGRAKIDHEALIRGVQDLAKELGRTPTRVDFCRVTKGGNWKLKTHYNDRYTELLQAAGLETYHNTLQTKVEKPKKIDNSIFNVDIENHLEEYKPQEPELILEPYPTAGIISDIHWPFANQKVVKRFVEYVGDVKPSRVIIDGDAWDNYSHGKFPRSHNIFTPKEEQNLARQMNEEFWKDIKRVSPESVCDQLMGNHDIRPLKRVIEAYPEAEDWVKEKINSLFTFDGVTTTYDPRQELFLNKQTIVFHGYRSQLGSHRDYTLYNCINGHTHRGGVVFRKIRGAVLWELNCGLSGDPEAKGLTYTPQKILDWTPGFGALDKLGPRFIPVV